MFKNQTVVIAKKIIVPLENSLDSIMEKHHNGWTKATIEAISPTAYYNDLATLSEIKPTHKMKILNKQEIDNNYEVLWVDGLIFRKLKVVRLMTHPKSRRHYLVWLREFQKGQEEILESKSTFTSDLF